MSQPVYKIIRAAEWDSAQHAGVFLGSPDDRRDGLIHLCTAAQLPGTFQRHFSRDHNLLLLSIDVVDLGDRVKWEISRDGELFPHLYGGLALANVKSATPIGIGSDERTILPTETAMRRALDE